MAEKQINLTAKMKMPELTIDNIVQPDGTTIPGVKRMFDIALQLKDSVMLWGLCGIGKSQGVQQWNKDKVEEYNQRIANGEKIKPWNPHVCDVRVSLMEPVNMLGIPETVIDGNGKRETVWVTPNMWPKDDGQYSGGVILLDEINQGQPAILNAAFQLIQDRGIGDYKVPEGYIIIAAANPSTINSTVTEFSIPLSNRFTHFNMKADFDSWLNYRLNNGGNIDVLTFLKTQDESLLFDTKTLEKIAGNLDDSLFTDVVMTPRSWEVIERLLALPEFTLEEKKLYATGRLGLGATHRLFGYLQEKEKYQDWHEILVHKKPFKSEDTNQFWAVQLGCISAINNCNDDKTCRDYVINFLDATRKLTNKPLKVINVTALIHCKRLQQQIQIFNPIQDAGDLLQLAADSLKIM